MKAASPHFFDLGHLLGGWTAEHVCLPPTPASWRPVPTGTRAASTDIYRCPECGQLLQRERSGLPVLVAVHG